MTPGEKHDCNRSANSPSISLVNVISGNNRYDAVAASKNTSTKIVNQELKTSWWTCSVLNERIKHHNIPTGENFA